MKQKQPECEMQDSNDEAKTVGMCDVRFIYACREIVNKISSKSERLRDDKVEVEEGIIKQWLRAQGARCKAGSLGRDNKVEVKAEVEEGTRSELVENRPFGQSPFRD